MLLDDHWDKVNNKVIIHANKSILNTKINTRIAEIEAEYAPVRNINPGGVYVIENTDGQLWIKIMFYKFLRIFKKHK